MQGPYSVDFYQDEDCYMPPEWGVYNEAVAPVGRCVTGTQSEEEAKRLCDLMNDVYESVYKDIVRHIEEGTLT